MKSYRRKENIQPKHSYIIRYLTHDTIGYVNRLEIDDTDMSIDDIAKTSLIGSSKDDYPIEIVTLIIDGKNTSKLELRAINARLFGNTVYECDGGGVAGGDAGGVPAGDIGGTASDGIDSGIHIDDVLGKNEPGKGYMGPGNFYIPSKVKVPFKRWDIAYGGSKRKKTKKGKDKKYSYEKGMKVVVDMFEEGIGIDKNRILSRLKNISKQVKTLRDAEKTVIDFDKKKDIIANKLDKAQDQSLKQTFFDFGYFIKDVCSGKHKASWFTISMIVVALIYVLSPIDLIPDAIPVAGILDDSFVIKLVYDAIKDEFNTWKANKVM